MGYGPGKAFSFEEYHTIPRGWEVDSVLEAYGRLQGYFDITPRQVRPDASPWFFYRQILLNIADGVLANDHACVELAVRFIEARVFVSYSGYMRSILARRLRKAELSAEQKKRLSQHFLGLLHSGTRCHEYADYLRLWKVFVTARELAELHRLPAGSGPDQTNFASFALAKLAPHKTVVRKRDRVAG